MLLNRISKYVTHHKCFSVGTLFDSSSICRFFIAQIPDVRRGVSSAHVDGKHIVSLLYGDATITRYLSTLLCTNVDLDKCKGGVTTKNCCC